MCFQDWRIGRLIRAVPHYAQSASGNHISVPRNMQRVGFTWTTGDGSGSSGVGSALLMDGEQIYLVCPELGGNVFHATIATHGDLPTHSFEGFGVGSNYVESFVEYLAPESMLTAALEEFQRQYPQMFR